MKKRLRKKKRVGEYKELGFCVGFKCEPELDQGEYDNLVDRFIANAIESNNLQFGGGGGISTKWFGFVAVDKVRQAASEKHRGLVKEWCKREVLVSDYYIGPLVDSWYGDFDEDYLDI